MRSKRGRREQPGPDFQNWLNEQEIVHEVTIAYLHESNDQAERPVRTLMNMAKSMLLRARNALENMWAKAIHTACFIRTRLVI